MLYDPKWEKQTKASPFSLDALIEWLEQRDPKETYCYASTGDCLLARYFSSLGYKQPNVGSSRFWQMGDFDAGYTDFPASFNQIALQKPRTFGAALNRARAARAVD